MEATTLLFLGGIGVLLVGLLRPKAQGITQPQQQPQPGYYSPELPPGFRTLRLTDPVLTGRDVRAVQVALQKHGVYFGSIHGVFDYATSEAVKAFQASKGLPVTGIVDANTWIALGVLVRVNGNLEVAPEYVIWRVR